MAQFDKLQRKSRSLNLHSSFQEQESSGKEKKHRGHLNEGSPAGDFGRGTFEKHVALLSDPRLSQRMYRQQKSDLVLGLQRDYGNTYVQRLVEHVSQRRNQGPQPKLEVGPAGDRYEREADATAKAIVEGKESSESREERIQRIQNRTLEFAQRLIQRENERTLSRMNDDGEATEVGLEGGKVSADTESSISKAKGSGQALPEATRSSMEGAFGANFAAVRVHTDSEADSLSRSMSARAFTTGKDIFFAKGEYNPGNKNGQETLAHELTHIVQQGAAQMLPATTEAQRVEFKDPDWVSSFDDSIKIDPGNGALTAGSSSPSKAGGHSYVYFEYEEGGAQTTKMADLIYGADETSGKDVEDSSVSEGSFDSNQMSSGPSASGKGTEIDIRMKTLANDAIKQPALKRSWAVPKGNVDAAMQRVTDMQGSVDNYVYKLSGTSIFKNSNTYNCAKFGEDILRAGGQNVSAGKIFKTPYELATGKKF